MTFLLPCLSVIFKRLILNSSDMSNGIISAILCQRYKTIKTFLCPQIFSSETESCSYKG